VLKPFDGVPNPVEVPPIPTAVTATASEKGRHNKLLTLACVIFESNFFKAFVLIRWHGRDDMDGMLKVFPLRHFSDLQFRRG
jgi:hypothetical protein